MCSIQMVVWYSGHHPNTVRYLNGGLNTGLNLVGYSKGIQIQQTQITNKMAWVQEMFGWMDGMAWRVKWTPSVIDTLQPLSNKQWRTEFRHARGPVHIGSVT